MIGAHLALMVLLGQTPSPSPESLVARLGAPRYSEREEAAGELERLGRKAVPALRAAHGSKDPEVRSRSAALLQKIEGALLTQPTMVKLDFDNRPVADVVKAVGEQTGMKLVLFPENLPAWQGLRINLQESTPLPFWKAIDRLCDEGHFYYNAAHGMPNGREPVFQLYYGGVRPSAPTSDQGPFRVSLLQLHYQHDVSFAQGGARINVQAPGMIPPPLPGAAGRGAAAKRAPRPAPPANPNAPNHTVSNQFYAQLQVAAEPRLTVSQNGPLKIVEAVDERGQSLVVPPGPGGMTSRTSGYFGLTTGSTIQLQAPLIYPSRQGAVMKKMRGMVPLTVATRKPNPLVVALAGSTGKTFQNEDVTLTIQEVKAQPGTNQTSIEITVKAADAQADSLAAGGVQGAEFVYHRPDMHQQQIEVTDAQGRSISWYHSSFDAEGSRMTLTLTPQDQATAPAQLRYYGLARAAADVGFEFNDVPMD